AEADGTLLKSLRAPAPREVGEGLQLLRSMALDCAGGLPIRSMGASVGGPLDRASGVVSPLHQPGWRNVPLKSFIEREFGCPLTLDVDTNVAALGEWRARGGPAGRLLYLTVSTGVGGGFVSTVGSS